ncbi:MAG: GNAT family N-acetyltransferase [Candidatus Egerieousia sp.]
MLYIDDICVNSSLRGRGVGRKLYEYTENFAKSIGCHNITLNVWTANPGAQRFYESLGLVPQKTTLEKIL